MASTSAGREEKEELRIKNSGLGIGEGNGGAVGFLTGGNRENGEGERVCEDDFGSAGAAVVGVVSVRDIEVGRGWNTSLPWFGVDGVELAEGSAMGSTGIGGVEVGSGAPSPHHWLDEGS